MYPNIHMHPLITYASIFIQFAVVPLSNWGYLPTFGINTSLRVTESTSKHMVNTQPCNKRKHAIVHRNSLYIFNLGHRISAHLYTPCNDPPAFHYIFIKIHPRCSIQNVLTNPHPVLSASSPPSPLLSLQYIALMLSGPYQIGTCLVGVPTTMSKPSTYTILSSSTLGSVSCGDRTKFLSHSLPKLHDSEPVKFNTYGLKASDRRGSMITGCTEFSETWRSVLGDTTNLTRNTTYLVVYVLCFFSFLPFLYVCLFSLQVY